MIDDRVLRAMTEREFQDAVVELYEWRGWLVWHDNDSRRNRAGLPDLIMAHERRGIVFAELKRAGGKARPEQVRWLNTLQLAAGGRRVGVYLWHPNNWTDIERIAAEGV